MFAIWPDGGRWDVHPDPAQGRGEEHKLSLGEGPDNPGGHGGEARQHNDDVVIHIKMVENRDKDEGAQVTHKVLIICHNDSTHNLSFFVTWIIL